MISLHDLFLSLKMRSQLTINRAQKVGLASYLRLLWLPKVVYLGRCICHLHNATGINWIFVQHKF